MHCKFVITNNEQLKPLLLQEMKSIGRTFKQSMNYIPFLLLPWCKLVSIMCQRRHFDPKQILVSSSYVWQTIHSFAISLNVM